MTTNERVNLQPTNEPTDETPAGAKQAFVIVVDHIEYQALVGVAFTQDEADTIVRIMNKGRYSEIARVIPTEALAIPALWKE